MKLPSQCKGAWPPCSPAKACPKLTGAGTGTGTDRNGQPHSKLVRQTSQGIDWCSKQSRQGERRPRSPHWSLPSFRPFFPPSSPRPVHMVIIIIPPPSFRPSGASRHALHPPPTTQDGQATAWFARRLFCWFVRCHCYSPFEVPDSTLPDLDSTSTSSSTSICSDPYLT